jgi:hypothetical protein
MKKINTNKDRLEDLKKRGNLIKESFQEQFNKIKRINESNEKHWTEEVTLENGVTHTVYLTAFKLWTSDTIDRYSISVGQRSLSKKDIQTLFALVADKHPTLTVGKINHHEGMHNGMKRSTEIIVWSTDEKIHSNPK